MDSVRKSLQTLFYWGPEIGTAIWRVECLLSCLTAVSITQVSRSVSYTRANVLNTFLTGYTFLETVWHYSYSSPVKFWSCHVNNTVLSKDLMIWRSLRTVLGQICTRKKTGLRLNVLKNASAFESQFEDFYDLAVNVFWRGEVFLCLLLQNWHLLRIHVNVLREKVQFLGAVNMF